MHNSIDNHELPDKKPWLPTGNLGMKIINLPLVIQNTNLHNCIRGLALHLLQCQYCNIGYFFKSLTQSDVDYLTHTWIVSQCETQDDRATDTSATQVMILLTLLLGRAEGKTDIDPKYITKALPNLGTLIQIEDMVRQKKLKVNYQNYSLTDVNKVVVLGKTAVELAQMFKQQGE